VKQSVSGRKISLKSYDLRPFVKRGPDLVKPETINVVFVASPLSMQLKRQRAKTGWLGNRIKCSSGVTHLSADHCFSELAYKTTTKHVGLVQSGPHLVGN
jgi:hypothetical protein